MNKKTSKAKSVSADIEVRVKSASGTTYRALVEKRNKKVTYLCQHMRGAFTKDRKIAEWGTAIQPACFGYDDMGNMTTLRTFRSGTETISTDPTERTDGDVTTWTFHPATGLELSKTYADGTAVAKTYDAYNRLATETDARGNVKTHSYEHARGLHLSTTYTLPSQSSEGATAGAATNARSFSYNHLGQLTQLTDDSGVRSFSYNTYGERESDSLAVDGDTHLVTELRDAFGRSAGTPTPRTAACSRLSAPVTVWMDESTAQASCTEEK